MLFTINNNQLLACQVSQLQEREREREFTSHRRDHVRSMSGEQKSEAVPVETFAFDCEPAMVVATLTSCA
jgi:hypothetical protein